MPFSNGASLPVSGMRILLGSHRANQPAPGQVTAGVISFIQMPQYNSTYFQKDVALIKLDRPVKFSTTILPACLAKAGDVFTVDRLCAVTGWGNKPENSPGMFLVLGLSFWSNCPLYHFSGSLFGPIASIAIFCYLLRLTDGLPRVHQ